MNEKYENSKFILKEFSISINEYYQLLGEPERIRFRREWKELTDNCEDKEVRKILSTIHNLVIGYPSLAKELANSTHLSAFKRFNPNSYTIKENDSNLSEIKMEIISVVKIINEQLTKIENS